jgi:hypothetical protein
MYVLMDVTKASEKDVCFRSEEPNQRGSSNGGPGQFSGFIFGTRSMYTHPSTYRSISRLP